MRAIQIRLPRPDLQIDFSYALAHARSLFLQEALGETVEKLDIALIDKQLSKFAPSEALSALAKKGLRGELLFAVPCILETNPRLIGYYRLLLGFSQKAFYATEHGLSRFKGMEDKGVFTQSVQPYIEQLCKSLSASAHHLLVGVGPERIGRDLLDDLTLLTLGPQLRGGANVKRGVAGIALVFQIIHQIVAPYVQSSNTNCIEIINAAQRRVFIEFSSDPDIIIREEISPNAYRNIIAIEIKGGMDFSNIHNRIGEAEKSHQKARILGYAECWTIVNVDRIDIKMAHRESPSTNRFYRLSHIGSNKGDEYQDFRNRLISLTGIPSAVSKRR